MKDKLLTIKEDKMEYTKGDWKVTDYGSHIRIGAVSTVEEGELDEHVCIIHNISEANARLIAAAPDLYEALKAIGEEPNFGLPGHLAVMRGKAIAKVEAK